MNGLTAAAPWWKSRSLPLLFGLLWLAGLGLRLLNFNNPALEFHPTRQLRSAIIARGMYYQAAGSAAAGSYAADSYAAGDAQTAIALWRSMEVLEPPILESLAAWTYRLIGSEQAWVARAYSVSFWMLAAALLGGLAWRASGRWAGLAALACMLFLPSTILASRSFQPDPLMILGLSVTALAAWRWSKAHTLSNALLTGLLAGLTILVKFQVIFPLAGMLGLLALVRIIPAARRPADWVGLALAAGLALAPAAAYYMVYNAGSSAGWLSQWRNEWLPMLLTPAFYFRWLLQLDRWASLPAVWFGLWGALLLPASLRPIVLGLWLGYGLLGLGFPYHFATHEYYHLPVAPTLALSLAPLAELLAGQFGLHFSQRSSPVLHSGTPGAPADQPAAKQRIAAPAWLALALAVAALAYTGWTARSSVLGRDDRSEALGWVKVGQELAEIAPQGRIMALTHDYGLRLEYYGWRDIWLWSESAHSAWWDADSASPTPAFEEMFAQRTANVDYFLVTQLTELARQPALQAVLARYPLAGQPADYPLYDLRPQP